ncbi:MAG TPA: YfcE family phosphodiesterase [Candidatus Limnocylindrales bacterium]|nr:YfcE family phosphodiesterase [Candidatus Limnocylindrales bacterium]
MKLGVLSDTHDKLENAAAALDYLAAQNVELLAHCGDWKSLSTLHSIAERAHTLRLPLLGVLGNNDLDTTGFLALVQSLPGDMQLQSGVLSYVCQGTRIAVYHGHHKPTLNRLRQSQDWNILLLGHTHKPLITQEPGRLIVNPGSTAFAIPRSRDWQPTVALVDTERIQASIEVVPL